MGIYLNPGNENFRKTLAADIYVDKSLMLEILNDFIDKGNSCICVSRPRRFGKTITGNMISAYYSKGCNSASLFKSLKIASSSKFKEKLNAYHVIQIDMNGEYQGTGGRRCFLSALTREIRLEFQQEFPDIQFEDDDTVARCILRVYAAKKQTFVILIDEYDVLVREQADDALFREYLAFLNGLFKNNTLRPAISLAYLTGILPVVRDKIQSKLNNFREYTVLNAGSLAEFIGFTSAEAKETCDKFNISYHECRHWYDGYLINGTEIYNPESVVRSIEERHFGSYWGQTSSYEAITDRIRQNFEGTKDSVIRMLAGENVPVNVTRFMNTMNSFKTRDDLFTYLIHLGYLSYDRETGTCRIPNREVRQEWFNAIETEENYAITDQIIKASEELLKRTWEMNEEAVSHALDRSHIHVSSNRSYNNEDVLQSAIYLAYLYALNRYTVVKEMTAGKGFADVVFIPFYDGDPAMIIELKKNSSPESALRQIHEKQYFESLLHYQGELLFVGISYNEKCKTHSCRIEKFRKD